MKHIHLTIQEFWKILKITFKKWYDADPFRESSIVAYYAIFSMPGLLVIVISLAGIVFGQEAARGEISSQIGSAIGNDAALQVEEMIKNAREVKHSTLAAIIGIITLLFGATGVFAQLQKSLNIIWEVEAKAVTKRRWIKLLKDRLFSFGLILSIGFLLLISLVITSVLTIISSWLERRLPDFLVYIFFIIEFLISLSIVSILFALIFKILPDAQIKWKHVWIGSLLTSVLFVIGKFLLGLYFGIAEPASTYGAAGSIILILLWASYSSMILFFGAEFTRQFTLKKEGEVKPMSIAESKPGRKI